MGRSAQFRRVVSGRSPRRPIPDLMGTSTITPAEGTLTSRAVLRDVEPGSTVDCTHCGERVKFQAKVRHKQVICNVYEQGRWSRVEHFHADCYEQAGDPHGEVDRSPVVRRRASTSSDAPAVARSA